jgi:MFS transporter, MHS family, proline/betaine transporter
VSLLQAFSLYAGGFLVRPMGSVLFGAIGDKWGAGRALQVRKEGEGGETFQGPGMNANIFEQISIFAMAIPTALVGVLPTYSKIGVAAPALLTFLRLLQGMTGTLISCADPRLALADRGRSWLWVGRGGQRVARLWAASCT